MPDEQKQKVVLHPSILAVAKTISEDANLSPDARLTGVLVLIWGWAWYERQETVDYRDMGLPKEQWLEVCGYLTHGVPGDKLMQVNLGLSFMNSGPSSIDD